MAASLQHSEVFTALPAMPYDPGEQSILLHAVAPAEKRQGSAGKNDSAKKAALCMTRILGCNNEVPGDSPALRDGHSGAQEGRT